MTQAGAGPVTATRGWGGTLAEASREQALFLFLFFSLGQELYCLTCTESFQLQNYPRPKSERLKARRHRHLCEEHSRVHTWEHTGRPALARWAAQGGRTALIGTRGQSASSWLLCDPTQPHVIPTGTGHQLCPPRHPEKRDRSRLPDLPPSPGPSPSPRRALPTS